MTTTTPRDFMTDMFKQAADSFARTMQAGVKFQEETAQFWTDLAGKNLDELRSQWDKFSLDATPFTKKNLEQFHKLFEEQTTRTLDLLRKTFDLGGSQNTAEICDRMAAVWRDSLDTIRHSTDAMAKANTEVFENCSEMIRKLSGAANGHGAQKPTAKAAAQK
ncbi:MAG: hypothetical protein LC135_16555 [Phycisphaerae bacterium]|jgi:hypothetical protein|nr:hypothetical protein [Phycisphaerae bacterium]MCZ2401451.1 hypothetical protein [Phycisphaerae bacterium]NUQ50148.1 hypothetical protein [Phycisphaerae bacterium]